ncbi:MAG TPA: tol-pal system protein YbgF [Stenotrophobium sp.]|jgi:tol-pal system protein YbgF|nr:tol-pal system protein YbgF [Stenotrophobium sp.]
MLRHTAIITALLGASLMSGCASTLDSGRIDGGSDALSPQERRLQTVETRLAELSRRVNGIDYASMDKDNQHTQDDLRNLRGEVERIRYDLDNLTKRNKDQYMDLDRRLQRFEGGAPTASSPDAAASTVSATAAPSPAAPAAPANSGGVPPPVVISSGSGASPEEEGAYLSAFDMLKNGKYDDAIRGFRSMLAKWPQGHYADNASYWMGEAFYVKRDYKSALDSFQSVLDKYPRSAKAPDAMLKVGLTQIQLNQLAQGKATLQKVIQTYPSANAANLAKQQLETLKSGN